MRVRFSISAHSPFFLLYTDWSDEHDRSGLDDGRLGACRGCSTNAADIAAGRRSAASIHQSLYGIPLSFSGQVVTPETLVQNVDHVENVETVPRRIMPLCPSPSACSEIEKGFTREMALSEASRCLQCGLICYNRTAGVPGNVEMTLSV